MSNRKTTPHKSRREAQFGFRTSFGTGVWMKPVDGGGGGYFYDKNYAATTPYIRPLAVAICLRMAAEQRTTGRYNMARRNVETATLVRRMGR